MAIELNICADSEVDKLLLEHNNRPMKALYEALNDTITEELPMAIIMDRRCGLERRAEEADVPRYLIAASPLMLASCEGRVDVAKALLAAGADPNAKDSTGNNSMLFSVRAANLEALEALLSYGADINAVDKDGITPLHYAAGLGHASVIELLERSGANLEAVDNDGCTPLHNAASNKQQISFNGNALAIKALLKLGANQMAVDKYGWTPLHCAAEADLLHISVATIESFRWNVAAFEANLTAVDKKGRTPLQVYDSYSTSDASEVRALLTPK